MGHDRRDYWLRVRPEYSEAAERAEWSAKQCAQGRFGSNSPRTGFAQKLILISHVLCRFVFYSMSPGSLISCRCIPALLGHVRCWHEALGTDYGLLYVFPGQATFTSFLVPPGIVCHCQHPGDVILGQDCLQHCADQQGLYSVGSQPGRGSSGLAGVVGFLGALVVVQPYRLVTTPTGDQPVEGGTWEVFLAAWFPG